MKFRRMGWKWMKILCEEMGNKETGFKVMEDGD